MAHDKKLLKIVRMVAEDRISPAAAGGMIDGLWGRERPHPTERIRDRSIVRLAPFIPHLG